MCGATPFGNSPHHQALPATRVTGGKNTRYAGRIAAVISRYTAVRCLRQLEFLKQPLFAAHKAHGQQHQLCRHNMFCTGDICRYHASVYLLPFILAQAQTADLAILTQEFLGCNAEFTRILLKFMDSLLLTVIRFKDTRELRPGIICCTAVRQTRIDFQLTHAAAALTDNGCHAIVAGITAAYDNNILILGINSKSVLQIAVQQALGYAFQIILSEVNTFQLTSGNRQITWHCCTGTQHYGIIFLQQCAGSQLYTDLAV